MRLRFAILEVQLFIWLGLLAKSEVPRDHIRGPSDHLALTIDHLSGPIVHMVRVVDPK